MAVLRLCVSEAQTQCRQAASSTDGAEGGGGGGSVDDSEPFTKLDIGKNVSNFILNMSRIRSYREQSSGFFFFVLPAGPSLTTGEELQLLRERFSIAESAP